MSNYPRLPFLFRAYLRREWPGWGRLLNWLALGGIDNVNARWRSGPTLRATGKIHGYQMDLNLSEDLERFVYFVGRYYDIEIQMAIDALVAPGDTFIDIGANIGMATLHAAHRVGPKGHVIAVEPQPSCCAKLEHHLSLNGIRHVEIHNFGLADRDCELTIRVLGGSGIMGTFAFDEASDRAQVIEEVPVRVVRGDDLLRGRINGRPVIKMDVEGFEVFALNGLIETIDEHRPPVITEVAPHHLSRAGVHEDQIFDFFHQRDYRGHAVEAAYRKLRRPRLRLRPIQRPAELGDTADVLWLPTEESRENRSNDQPRKLSKELVQAIEER